MSDIMDFLLEQIAEDQRVADATFDGLFALEPDYPPTEADVARWERMNRECEAKRKIIKLHEDWPVLITTEPVFERDDSDINTMAFRMTQQIHWATEKEYVVRSGTEPPTAPMIRALAQVYADRPGFREKWR